MHKVVLGCVVCISRYSSDSPITNNKKLCKCLDHLLLTASQQLVSAGRRGPEDGADFKLVSSIITSRTGTDITQWVQGFNTHENNIDWESRLGPLAVDALVAGKFVEATELFPKATMVSVGIIQLYSSSQLTCTVHQNTFLDITKAPGRGPEAVDNLLDDIWDADEPLAPRFRPKIPATAPDGL